MLYASEVWYEDIKEKVTYLKDLNALQRKMINAITGSYKCENTEKLLDLIKINNINEELLIKSKILEIEREEKRIQKEIMRKELQLDKDSYGFPLEVQLVQTKYPFYIITGKGPFRDFLYKIKQHPTEWCRYCGYCPETAIHLMLECEHFIDKSCLRFKGIEEFERVSKLIITKLLRDQFM
jgi:hypothetical protein